MRALIALVAAVLAVAGALGTEQAPAPATGGRVPLLELTGPIGPATSDFVVRGLERAAAEGAPAVILRIDTPGGLDTSMREIIKAILASPVPVIAYVAPDGARAASAGTYIVYASHVAAMAPATNLGAATPIMMTPGPLPGGGDRPAGGGREPRGPDANDAKDARDGKGAKDQGGDGGGDTASDEDGAGGHAEPASPMERKAVNDAVAYIRGLAALRGRNADWAERAVRRGASLSAPEALERNVVDLIAKDVTELIAIVDGREVEVAGARRTIDTSGWQVVTVEPDWRTRLLAILTNPNVAYVLMLLGIYGLFFELYSPGTVIPGVVGAISLVLALYAFHVLPVNYAGLALVVLGVAFLIAEMFLPSFGALGVGGVVSFVVGSIILFDTDVEGFGVSLPLVVTIGTATGAIFATVVYYAVRQRGRPVVTGREELVGSLGEALEDFDERGTVRVHGEEWTARARAPVRRGEQVRVAALDGLTLEVEPLPTSPREGS